MKINYYCPDFYTGLPIYQTLIKWRHDYPEYFNDFNISAVFGNFPNMVWNGGSVLTTSYPIFNAEIQEMYYAYQELGISMQLACTNSSLQKSHLEDEFCNQVLEICEHENNRVLVSTEMMFNYISTKYPKYKIDRSIVNTGNDYNWNEALNKYNNIVLPRRHCYDIDWMKQTFKPEDRQRIEILCNDPCPINCPYINTHYQKFERLTIRRGPDLENALLCENLKIRDNLIHMDYDYLISEDIIQETYAPAGFTSMKLSGRGTKQKILNAIIPYFVKKEYQIPIYSKFIDEVGI